MEAILADECVSSSLVQILRQRDVDVRTVAELGLAGAPDTGIVAAASRHGRAVLTANRRHYHTLHKASPGHAGIITYPDGPDTEELAAAIIAAIRDHQPLAGKLIRVRRPPAGTTVEDSPAPGRT